MADCQRGQRPLTASGALVERLVSGEPRGEILPLTGAEQWDRLTLLNRVSLARDGPLVGVVVSLEQTGQNGIGGRLWAQI